MIPFDFEYYRPVSVDEAVVLYAQLDSEGKQPLYYGGGTEIISFARLNGIFTRAVIDIKGIPECNVLRLANEKLVVGSAVTLTRIQESNLFPLLSRAAGRVADHTVRGKITLGGNICSRIPYREAVLPLLVAESELIIAGLNGRRTVQIREVFEKVLLLQRGELLLQVITEEVFTILPFVSMKKTQNGDVGYPQDRIGYPVVSLAACKKDGRIRAAFSGACNYPFRSASVERELNMSDGPIAEKVGRAVNFFPEPPLNDMESSSGYRAFAVKCVLEDTLQALGGM